MAEEINYYDEELFEVVAEIEKGIDGLRKFRGAAKLEVQRDA